MKTSRAAPVRPIRGRALVVAVMLTLVRWGCPGLASTSEGPCDPRLKQSPGDQDGYKLRGDRCEGIYVREVSDLGTLQVASLTSTFEDYDPKSGRELVVRWATLGDGSVRLRGVSLRPKRYYRMDAVRPVRDTPYAWPSTLLGRLDIPRPELGVVAWTSYRVGTEPQDVYLPLRIGPEPLVASKAYDLVLLPDAELREVYVTVAQVGDDGRPAGYVERDRPLNYGYYPAGRKVTIKLAEPSAPGIYLVEIGAALADGRTSTARLLFHHAK